jgi:hypothetical protein
VRFGMVVINVVNRDYVVKIHSYSENDEMPTPSRHMQVSMVSVYF